MQSGIRASRRWVLTHEESPSDLTPMHLAEVTHLREVLVELAKPPVSVVGLGGGGLAVPGFQEADRELGHVGPPAPERVLSPQPLRSLASTAQITLPVREVLAQRRVAGDGPRLRQIARQRVEQHRDIRGALDARMPPERQNPATGAPYVAQQELDDPSRADHLRARRVQRRAPRWRGS